MAGVEPTHDADDSAHPAGDAGVALGDVVRRGDGIATRLIADETLLVPFKGTLASLQQIFALSPVAAFVWQRLDGKATLDAILADVLASFEVDRARAWADLQELIAGLRKAGLVHANPGSSGDTSGA